MFIKTDISLVYGKKTKLELWAGPVGGMSKIGEFLFDKDRQEQEWNISEYLYFDSPVTSGSTLTFELRRANYNEGDDCVFAMGEFYAYSTLDVLKISGSQLVAPVGTPVKLTATYTEPVTQQRLHWFQGESIGGYPYFPEIVLHHRLTMYIRPLQHLPYKLFLFRIHGMILHEHRLPRWICYFHHMSGLH